MTTSRTTWVVLLLVPFAMSAILVLPNPVSHVAAGEYNGATDFDYFYSGAELFAQGRYEELYDPEVFPQLLDRTEPKLWYAYSPVYARAWGPLTRFSIDSAWVIWTLLSAALIALAAAISAAKWRAAAAILAIASFPAAMNLQLGQNAAVSAALIGIAHAMIVRGRPIGAGLALGLMFKPQLAIGVGLWWLVDRRYRSAALTALATVAGTAGLGWLLDGSAWRLYWSGLTEVVGIRGQHLQMSIAGLTDLAFPEWGAARTAGSLLGLATLAATLVWLARRPRDPMIAFVVITAVTLLATPYVLMYDYLIMLVPLVALVTSRDLSALWIPAILLSWAVPFSAAATDEMIEAWGFGIQIAPIALAIAVVSLVRNAPESLSAFVVPKSTL